MIHIFYKELEMKRTLISALVAGCVGLASMAASAGTVVVNGSTTVLPAMQKISETFMAKHKDIQVSISGGGSGHGIKALIEKTTDVAMASRDIKPAEVENVKKNGGEAVRFTVAVDAIVPIVHPKNTVKDLSLQQIRDIYAGRITNWKEVGGPDARITVVSRDSSSGTFETWEELVMKGERVQQRALLQASNGAVLQTVAKNPNAIGYVGLGYITKDIVGLNIGGVKASADTALSRKWPLARDLYLFTNGQPKGDTKTLIDYALSAEGQVSVKEVGFVPLPSKK